MRDDNVYRKTDTGEYVPFGYTYNRNENYLPDGIWVVHHAGCGTTSIPWLAGIYKIGDPKNLKLEDCELITGLEEIYDRVMQSEPVRDVINDKSGYCIADLVRAVIKTIYLKQDE